VIGQADIGGVLTCADAVAIAGGVTRYAHAEAVIDATLSVGWSRYSLFSGIGLG
jgi:hypothetical protein